MKNKLIPISNNPGCREKAAVEIAKLRRKGVHCHLEEHLLQEGNCIEVVLEDGPPPSQLSRRAAAARTPATPAFSG